MRRIAVTLGALALVGGGFTLRATDTLAAHAGPHATHTNNATRTNTNTNNGNHTQSSFTATTYTVSAVVAGEFQHTYTLATNPFCSTALSGTGNTPSGSYYATSENVTGSFSPTSVSYTATYTGPYNPGYWYSVTSTSVTQTAPNTYSFTGTSDAGLPVTGTVTMNTNTFQNRGAYIQSLSAQQRAAFQSACGTTTSGEDQDTDSDEQSGDQQSGDEQSGDDQGENESD